MVYREPECIEIEYTDYKTADVEENNISAGNIVRLSRINLAYEKKKHPRFSIIAYIKKTFKNAKKLKILTCDDYI